jgi:Lamin Tail Domain
MKSDAGRHIVWFVASMLVLLSMTPACIPTPKLPKSTPPKAQVTQPSTPAAASDNQSANETATTGPSADEQTWYPVVTFNGVINETTPVFHIYGTEWHLKWNIDTDNPEIAVFKVAIYPKQEPYAIWQTFSNAGNVNGTINYFVSGTDKRDLFIKVTALNLRQWTIAIEDNAIAATSYPVKIYFINYKGTFYPPDPTLGICYERNEPDEYVVIKNLSTCYQDMTGWSLKNISRPSPTFIFPQFLIYPGQILRVYTDEYHEESGGFNFNWGHGDLWSNVHPDIAVLYDAVGNEVSRKSYTILNPTNDGASDVEEP